MSSLYRYNIGASGDRYTDDNIQGIPTTINTVKLTGSGHPLQHLNPLYCPVYTKNSTALADASQNTWINVWNLSGVAWNANITIPVLLLSPVTTHIFFTHATATTTYTWTLPTAAQIIAMLIDVLGHKTVHGGLTWEITIGVQSNVTNPSFVFGAAPTGITYKFPNVTPFVVPNFSRKMRFTITDLTPGAEAIDFYLYT